MKQILIERRQLAAILECAPQRNDIRYYLNGVMLELLPHEARLVATDGHMMGVIRIPKVDSESDVIGQYIIPRDVLKLFKLKNVSIPLVLNIVDKNNGAFEEPGGFSVQFKFIDGKYPNYRNVIPKGKLSGESGHFNPALLARFSKAAKLIGHTKSDFSLSHNGKNSSALVTVPGFSDFIGIVMPMRTDDSVDHAPAWALGPEA